MIKQDLNAEGRLSNEQIIKLVLSHMKSADVKKYTDNEAYFKGLNPTIMGKEKKDSGVPDNRVPIPYARKVSLTTKNYMFNKPVVYHSENQAFIDSINENNNINDYNKKTTDVGLDLIVHGTSYKLFYIDAESGIIPRYVVIEQNEIMPIYSYDIEPKQIAAIRYYKRGMESTYYIEVYYGTVSQKFTWDGNSKDITPDGEEMPHDFPGVPLVIYGDSYGLGIFDAVKPIIDGIDSIASSDLDEIQKFALAYLVLQGQKVSKEIVDKVKDKRLWEIDKEATLAYLTKTLDSQFNGNVRDFLVSEIHKQTGVPDFAAKEFAAESGVALLYKLMGFENLASDLQAVFESGERSSVKMQAQILFRSPVIPDDFWVEMTRNLPRNVMEKVQEAVQLKAIGISQETILDTLEGILPVDVETEVQREDDEKSAYTDLMSNQFGQQDQNNDNNPDDITAQ